MKQIDKISLAELKEMAAKMYDPRGRRSGDSRQNQAHCFRGRP
jgi:hypothetical protein